MILKSRFLAGRQCTKLLWHLAKAPAELPAVDAATQTIFDQGAEVGRLARTLFPGGILIDHNGDPEQAIIDTQTALDARKPVFEGAFEHNGASCRVDVLAPVDGDRWDLIEVKSTTGVEDAHVHDVAFQAWVLTGAEVKLRLCWVMHLDSGYVRHGDLDPARLFQRVDVTSQIQALSREIEDQLDEMGKVIRQPAAPLVEIGKKCDAPYTCPLKDKCWSFLPVHSVFQLYRGGNRSWQLFLDRIHAIKDISDEFKLSAKQETQRRAVRTGKPHINRSALRKFLERLTYPVRYVDFETINPAIPMYNGTSPYQQLPFQFSLHIQADPDADPVHHSFLAAGAADPRREFLESLVRHIGPAGSVVAYNAGFELRVLRECCALLPDYRPWLDGVERRMVDLLEPFRAFHYYHPAQKGSASMKAVLPALTGGGYDHLAIQDGGTASREFQRITLGEIDPAERLRVRGELERYCALDTMGMVEIVDALARLVLTE
jgi:hypothetical protein